MRYPPTPALPTQRARVCEQSCLAAGALDLVDHSGTTLAGTTLEGATLIGALLDHASFAGTSLAGTSRLDARVV